MEFSAISRASFIQIDEKSHLNLFLLRYNLHKLMGRYLPLLMNLENVSAFAKVNKPGSTTYRSIVISNITLIIFLKVLRELIPTIV